MDINTIWALIVLAVVIGLSFLLCGSKRLLSLNRLKFFFIHALIIMAVAMLMKGLDYVGLLVTAVAVTLAVRIVRHVKKKEKMDWRREFAWLGINFVTLYFVFLMPLMSQYLSLAYAAVCVTLVGAVFGNSKAL